MIYLDNAANAPVKDEVLDEFCRVEKTYLGNANSIHEAGKASNAFYEECTNKLLNLLGLDPFVYEVVYTSGATESNNLAISGVANAYSGFGDHFLSSEFEHSSVNAPLSALKDKGARIDLIKTKENGHIDLDDLKTKLDAQALLVTLCAVKSEVGTLQPIQEAQKIVNQSNAKLLVDATQALGKLPVDLNGIDLISFTPHKFGGIIGTGVLVKKKEIILAPLLRGGKSQSPYRSGTLALGLVASIVKAVELALTEEKENYEKAKVLWSNLHDGLSQIEGVRINSFEGNPYILNFSYDYAQGGALVKYLSEKGICISQKSACSVATLPSKVINAIYHDKKRALSSVRVSLWKENTKEDIDALLTALKEFPR